MMRRPNRMKLHEALEIVRRQGKRGDTELAHVNPREKALLKAMGGVGTRNPRTGLRQYYAGVDPGSSYGEGGWGGAPGSANSLDGGASGYGGGAQQGVVERDSISPPGEPMDAPTATDRAIADALALSRSMPPSKEMSWGETIGRALGLYDEKTAGPALAGFLGGSPFGLMATAGQAIGDWARSRGYSVIDGAPHRDPAERAAWDAMFDGMPQGPGENINAALASYQPPTPQFTRAGEVAVPSEIAPFMGGDMSEMQRRALISTYGYMGTNPAFRDKPAQRYYASLLSRELVNPQMQLNQTPTQIGRAHV